MTHSPTAAAVAGYSATERGQFVCVTWGRRGRLAADGTGGRGRGRASGSTRGRGRGRPCTHTNTHTAIKTRPAATKGRNGDTRAGAPRYHTQDSVSQTRVKTAARGGGRMPTGPPQIARPATQGLRQAIGEGDASASKQGNTALRMLMSGGAASPQHTPGAYQGVTSLPPPSKSARCALFTVARVNRRDECTHTPPRCVHSFTHAPAHISTAMRGSR